MVRLKELKEFRQKPFTFRLSGEAAASRLQPGGNVPVFEAMPCSECGSVVVLGGDRLRLAKQNGKAFCDIQCAGDYKRWHNKTAEYQQKAGIAENREAKQRQNEELEKAKWICCDWCWNAFKRTSSMQKYCNGCGNKNKEIHKTINRIYQSGWNECGECGVKFFTSKRSSMRKYCSSSCLKRSVRRTQKHKRRCVKRTGYGLTIYALMKRFGSKCAICGVKVVKHTGGYVANGATIDHVLPLSKGGFHVRENVQLACHSCNSKKTDAIKVNTQALLF
jgi:hypothetical protein